VFEVMVISRIMNITTMMTIMMTIMCKSSHLLDVWQNLCCLNVSGGDDDNMMAIPTTVMRMKIKTVNLLDV
jgi:hypothetical protein